MKMNLLLHLKMINVLNLLDSNDYLNIATINQNIEIC